MFFHKNKEIVLAKKGNFYGVSYMIQANIPPKVVNLHNVRLKKHVKRIHAINRNVTESVS